MAELLRDGTRKLYPPAGDRQAWDGIREESRREIRELAKAYAGAAATSKGFPEENQNIRQNTAGIPQKKFSEMTDEEFAEVKKQVAAGKYKFG